MIAEKSLNQMGMPFPIMGIACPAFFSGVSSFPNSFSRFSGGRSSWTPWCACRSRELDSLREVLSSKASEAGSKEKQSTVKELESCLKNKKDRLNVDFFETLGEDQLALGNRQDAIETYTTIADISLEMASALDDGIRMEVFGEK